MTQYYFLATVLPPLQFETDPDIRFETLITFLRENLTDHDWKQAAVIRRYYDLLNIRSFLKGERLDPHGNWNENQLDEALLDRIHIPKYLNEFLDAYDTKAERISHFSLLLAAYFREEEKHASGFLRKFLKLEREMRLVLVAFRAKKLGRDLVRELQYEDPEETIIAQLLAQKDDVEFYPPEPYEDLKPIFDENSDDPTNLHLALLRWRYEKIQEMVAYDQFGTDTILGYLARFILLENWLELDKNAGTQIVDSIVKERT